MGKRRGSIGQDLDRLYNFVVGLFFWFCILAAIALWVLGYYD